MIMATNQASLPLLPLPEEWTAEKDFKAIGALTAATKRNIEPVGRHFLAYARRKRHHRTFSEDERIQAQEDVKKVEDDESSEISEPEDALMLQREAKDWKGQDHYAVLGLSRYRHQATAEQIKRAHRKKVLRHHPDKKAAAGSTEDDSFFKCIQKATEILLDPVKRRQFDSVDENANVDPPTKRETVRGDFYALWAPVFASEGRFSKALPVPGLGHADSSKAEVEAFYNFWYNFDSWRSFEYEDEDVPDDNENRDQKRFVERKNNAARKKKKTEDTARLRKLVDDALSYDARIKRFRQLDRASKDARRLEKEADSKRAAAEAAAAKHAAARAQQAADDAARAQKADDKKTKDAAKNAAKKNKRVLKAAVKEANYWHRPADGAVPPARIDAVLSDVELLMATVDLDELAAVAARLSDLMAAGAEPDALHAVFQLAFDPLLADGRLHAAQLKVFAVPGPATA
ncbi:MAG: hypothetical protein M1826_006807 [Phylliscum demangeonii]|nr:MAG: hypothetical protein M1826_006807 [Phylliscum demangeonii]